MTFKVLIYSRFPKAIMVRIGERFELMDAAGKPPGEVFTAQELSDVTAMITAGGTPLGAAVMDTLPSLRAIVCYGTGYDGVDFAAAAQRGIAVAHSPAANAAAVADLALALMLAATRRLLPAHDYVRSGNWAAARSLPASRHSRPRSAISAAANTTCRIDICRALRRWRNGAASSSLRCAPASRPITPSMPAFCNGSGRTATSSTSRAAR